MGYALEGSGIDLERTRVLIFSWPDGHWNPLLRSWIRGRFWRRTEHLEEQIIDVVCPGLDIICARNWAIKEHVINNPSFYQHFLFIERDVEPDVMADEIFRITADIACCRVKLRNVAGWSKEDAFHAPMWMASRSTLERIQPPWFQVVYNEDGTKRVQDECEYFRGKALEAGLTIAHSGYAGHGSEGSWCG